MTPLVLPSASTSRSFIVYASLGYAHSTIATETGDLVSCGFNRFGQQVCNPSVQTLPPFSSDQEASSGGSAGHFLKIFVLMLLMFLIYDHDMCFFGFTCLVLRWK